MMRTDTCLYCDRKVPVNMTCNCPKSVTITSYCSECVDLEARIKELEGVLSAARAILTCISDVDDGCALVSCGDHAKYLREALAKLEEPSPSEKDKCEATGCIGCRYCMPCSICHKQMEAVRPGKWQCDCEEE